MLDRTSLEKLYIFESKEIRELATWNNKFLNEEVTLDVSCIQQKYLPSYMTVQPTLSNRPVHEKLLVLDKS